VRAIAPTRRSGASQRSLTGIHVGDERKAREIRSGHPDPAPEAGVDFVVSVPSSRCTDLADRRPYRSPSTLEETARSGTYAERYDRLGRSISRSPTVTADVTLAAGYRSGLSVSGVARCRMGSARNAMQRTSARAVPEVRQPFGSSRAFGSRWRDVAADDYCASSSAEAECERG